MAASLSGEFNSQQFADNGVPLAGGRLYTYAYGTTTLKVAYTDAAGLVPHTYTLDAADGQYIALNARGELPAPLYLAAGSYDLSLKRADGSTVWTRRADPMTDPSTLASTASGQGASLVGINDAGSLIAATTVEGALQEVATSVNLKAPIASPTFTGVPKAPTASAADNSTQLATTAFVTTAVGNATASLPTLASGTYTPTLTGVLNVTATSLGAFAPWTWVRVGNTVTVSGVFIVQPTANTTATSVNATIPVARGTNFTSGQAAGAGVWTVSAGAVPAVAVSIVSQSPQLVLFSFTSSSTSNASLTFTFQYTLS